MTDKGYTYYKNYRDGYLFRKINDRVEGYIAHDGEWKYSILSMLFDVPHDWVEITEDEAFLEMI